MAIAFSPPRSRLAALRHNCVSRYEEESIALSQTADAAAAARFALNRPAALTDLSAGGVLPGRCLWRFASAAVHRRRSADRGHRRLRSAAPQDPDLAWPFRPATVRPAQF